MLGSKSASVSFPPRKILVAIDGSENAQRATNAAIELAKKFHSELIVLSVVPHPGSFVAPAMKYYDYYETTIQKWIDAVIQNCSAHGVVDAQGRIIRAQPSIPGAIVEVAELEHIDLIVIGHRGLSMLKGGFKRVIAGSVSSAVTTHAHCNVLVVR